jgi:hypothetical protein
MGEPNKNETEEIRNEGFSVFATGAVLNNSEGGANMAKNSVCAVAGVVACGLAFSAQAGEKQQFSSIVFGKQINETKLQLEGANAYGTFATDEVVISIDLPESHPLQNLSGKCTGVGEKLDGKGKMGGHCVYSNPNGGKFALSFVADPHLKPEWGGSFEMSGIEGNAVGWKASCKWGKTVDFSGERYVQRWLCAAEKP